MLTLPDPSCTDADGETLTYEIVTPPAHGTLGDPGAGGGRTYTPDPGFAGDDSFTFRASDGVDAVEPADGDHHRHAAAQRPAGVLRRQPQAGPRRAGDDPARLHRPRRRPGDARDGRRAGARHARRGRPGHRPGRLHARSRLHGHRLVHLPRHRRHAGRAGRDRLDRRHGRPGVPGRRAHHPGRHGGVGAADLHRSRRGRADAVDRRWTVEGLAGRDERRRGDLHAGRGPVRRRLLHIPGVGRDGAVGPGDRLDHHHAPAELRPTFRAPPRSAARCRCR